MNTTSTISTTSTTADYRNRNAKFVISLLKDLLLESKDVWLPTELETSLYEFLRPKAQERIQVVVLNTEVPSGDGYINATFENEAYVLTVAFGKNNIPSKPPYVLFASFKKKKVQLTREEQFRLFWINRGLPSSLLGDVVQNLDFDKPIKIDVFQYACKWKTPHKADKAGKLPIVYIGQTPDAKTGSFLPLKPIGYVIPQLNRVVLTAPYKRFEQEKVTYTFN